MTAPMLSGPNITGTTRLLGIIGNPVEHSLSPIMQNAAIAHLNMNYVYLPFPVDPSQLSQALQGLDAIGVQGFNVTIPHKQAVMPLLQSVSETAQAIGAVNTIYRGDTGWHGTNTDIIGFLAPLNAYPSWTDGSTIVLGNGGAARAVVAGCAQQGCRQVQVVGRNVTRLNQFLASWEDSPLKPNLTVHPWDDLLTLLSHAKVVVNTTPVGMHPHTEASPLKSDERERIAPGSIAYDLIYTPSPTLFLQQAEEQGAIAIDGREMLVQQGAAALELWLQMPAPVDVMRQTLNYALEL